MQLHGHDGLVIGQVIYVISHLGQLSLLPSAGWEIRTSQRMVKPCSLEYKQVWLISPADKRVGGR